MTDTATTAGDYEVPPPPEEVDTVDWKPRIVGDELVGTLRRRMTANTKFGQKEVLEFANVETLSSEGSPVAVPDGNNVTVWPTPGMLTAIDFFKCGIGDRFGVKLVELVDTDKGNPFKKFGVKLVKRADTTTAQPDDTPEAPF